MPKPLTCSLCGGQEPGEDGNCAKCGIKLRKNFPDVAITLGIIGASLALVVGMVLKAVFAFALAVGLMGLGLNLLGSITYADYKPRRIFQRVIAGILHGAAIGWLLAFLVGDQIAGAYHIRVDHIRLVFMVMGAVASAFFMLAITVTTGE